MKSATEWLSEVDHQTCLIFIHAQPGAKKSGLSGLHGQKLKWKINSQATEGKANKELCSAIAEILGTSRQKVDIVRGHLSRSKTVKVTGLSAEKISSIILQLL